MNTFVLVINYLSDSWNLMHVIIGLFEVHEIARLSMAGPLFDAMESYYKNYYKTFTIAISLTQIWEVDIRTNTDVVDD